MLPIVDFLTTKIREYNTEFDLREGTAFMDLFIKPQAIIMQPFRDELEQIRKNQTILTVLTDPDPNNLPEDAIDALVSNVFVNRVTGDNVTGTVRAFFIEPRALNILSGEAIFFDKLKNRFVNTENISITVRQMSLQVSGDYYYVDISVKSEEKGNIKVGINDIVTWESPPSGYVSVGNPEKFSEGADKESNVELIIRAKNSIAVRDLVTRKGAYGTLFDNFTSIEEMTVIGFGDPEMMRDIIYNTHIGGNVDIYIKTPQFLEKTYDVQAVTIDGTRLKTYHSKRELHGTNPISFGIISIDRTNYDPIVQKMDTDTEATYTTTVDLAGGIDLSLVYNINIEVKTADGIKQYQVGIQGATPENTTRSEIISKINTTFGFDLASEYNNGSQQFIKFTSPTIGSSAYIKFLAPATADATLEVLGLSEVIYPHIFTGTDRTIYVENTDYTINDIEGTISRIGGAGISDGELVEITFQYNPVSIDIGKPVRQDNGTYTIRTGRDGITITDVPLMYIKSIELVDPISGEGTGEFLDGIGGFGQGNFGRGGFGVGSGSDYRLVVVQPHLRYSVLEENYIEIVPKYLGLTLRVTYWYSQQINDIHAFVMSHNERVMASNILVKNYIPAFVDTKISYSVRESDSEAPSNEEMVNIIYEGINDIPNAIDLEISDFIKLLYDYGAIQVDLPVTFKMDIHHIDGTVEKKQSQVLLELPNPTLPKDTIRSVSPRITHFIPRNIELIRKTVP